MDITILFNPRSQPTNWKKALNVVEQGVNGMPHQKVRLESHAQGTKCRPLTYMPQLNRREMLTFVVPTISAVDTHFDVFD